jgi:hypothetical protein
MAVLPEVAFGDGHPYLAVDDRVMEKFDVGLDRE